MIGFYTFAVIAAVTYALLREGLATSFTMFVNVILAGLIAFNFFEPAAEVLGPMLAGSPLQGCEDGLSLAGLFALALGGLRLAGNAIAPTQITLDARLDQVGAGLVGALTGYLTAGFLVCVLQTLPWHENFMSFNPQVDREAPANRARRWLPPDRVWLATMSRASSVGFRTTDGGEFDPNGTFSIRYARHRRYADDREPIPSAGEATP